VALVAASAAEEVVAAVSETVADAEVRRLLRMAQNYMLTVYNRWPWQRW
jgi:hypothetical protein